ncbi:hypothetical protein GCM10009834_44730 [Streptomonospora arabica]
MTGDGGATGTVGHGAAGRRGPEGPSPFGAHRVQQDRLVYDKQGARWNLSPYHLLAFSFWRGRTLGSVYRTRGGGLYFVLALTAPAAAERA